MLGVVAYWGFLIFWSLVWAYLFVVREAHNRLADALGVLLFGAEAKSIDHGHSENHSHTNIPKDAHIDEHPPRLFKAQHASHIYFVPPSEHEEEIHPASTNDLVDEFIVTQIERIK